ncbi:hypothetical protein FB472_1205 [Rhodoglobus vestalii]|uniref:Uncharacterized protein n=1 Tax=Rhodoglobus vestalii TaxID=193384 RepID=A0A8H2KAE4_9MICO|nr:hypothetical protein [Rhodoglobus vestalii]TQO19636.1 hypothetical protein FB472_1205 [Rhodoglobus vestalii]
MARKVFTVTPPSLTRSERRQRAKETAALTSQKEETGQSQNALNLPPAAVPGMFGPGVRTGEYWNLMRLQQPHHQATSHHVAGIYPFIADRGLGHRGPILGVDLNADSLWHFSPWDLYTDTTSRAALSTNILVLGAYRSGKSGVLKMLTTRSIPFGHQVVVPSDSKGEWVAVCEATPGGKVIRVGGPNTTARINPLDGGPRRSNATDDEHLQMVHDRRHGTLRSIIELTLSGQPPLTPMEHASISWALDTAIDVTGDRPTLTAVSEQLENIDATSSLRAAKLFNEGERARYVLKRFIDGDLRGLFEHESTAKFDDEAPMVVVDTSELFQRGNLVAQLTQLCTSAWIQAVISDRAAKKTRYLIREEGWRDMSSVAALQTLQQWLKLSRHYGISNVLILHKFSDLDAVGKEGSEERALAYSIAADIENKFIFRVNQQEEDNLVKRLKLPPQHVLIARRLRSGTFIAYVGLYSYLVDAFVTSTQWEYELFKTDDAVEGAADIVANPVAELDFRTQYLDDLWPLDEPNLDQIWPSTVPVQGHKEKSA